MLLQTHSPLLAAHHSLWSPHWLNTVVVDCSTATLEQTMQQVTQAHLHELPAGVTPAIIDSMVDAISDCSPLWTATRAASLVALQAQQQET